MKRILFSLFCSINIFAMEISKENLFVPHKLGALSVVKKDRGFSVLKDGQEHKVASYNTDEMLNKMNSKQLAAFLANNGGRIDVNQLSDDEYTLKAKVHGKGGGFLTGLAFYGTVKAIGYGVVPPVIGGLAACTTTTAIDKSLKSARVPEKISENIAVTTAATGYIAVSASGIAASTAVGAAYVAGVETTAAAAMTAGTALWFLP